MKETKIAYFPPTSSEWEQMMEHALDNSNKVTKDQIQHALDTEEAFIYTLPEFVAAFNDEAISDQGVILQLI